MSRRAALSRNGMDLESQDAARNGCNMEDPNRYLFRKVFKEDQPYFDKDNENEDQE